MTLHKPHLTKSCYAPSSVFQKNHFEVSNNTPHFTETKSNNILSSNNAYIT